MNRSNESLFHQMARAVHLHANGDENAAFDVLLAGLDCSHDACALACGMANAIAESVTRPPGARLFTDITGDTTAAGAEDVDVATLAAAVIAAVGNDDVEGAVQAWVHASEVVRSRTLWHLLRMLSVAVQEMQR